MTTSRRRFLALSGGGVVLAATAATAGFVATRTPTKALEPWETAGAYPDPRLRAMSHALLAPNPHNRQPWLARLDGEDSVVLHMDPDRRLPATDPHDRQLVIGMGCFVELMTQAAGAEELAIDLDITPTAGPNATPVIRATFRPGGSKDPLFAAVFDRRSCKEPMDMTRPVQQEALDTVLAAARDATAQGTTDPNQTADLADLMWAAWQTEVQTPAAHKESVDLFRIGKRQINANPDGIDLGGAMMEALQMAGQMDREAMLDSTSMAFRSSVDIYREIFAATPAAVWLMTAGNSRLDQLAAGRAWLRLNLAATRAGLGLHPVSQALQEYPQMAPHYRAIHSALAQDGQTVQMLGRIGYGPATPRTPRWPLETRMISA